MPNTAAGSQRGAVATCAAGRGSRMANEPAAMSTGTTASNASGGVSTSRSPPVSPPATAVRPWRPTPPRSVPRSSWRLPMTAARERVWSLQRLDPGDTGYHVASVQRLRGPLDVAALRASLDAVVARHEPLRTRFPTGPDGRAYQEIQPPAAVPV